MVASWWNGLGSLFKGEMIVISAFHQEGENGLWTVREGGGISVVKYVYKPFESLTSATRAIFKSFTPIL